MRIGFTGAQGTGKTVTAQALAKRPEFKDYYLPPSSARTLGSKEINTSASPLSQMVITVDRIHNIRRSPDVITDRTAIDSWAYTQYQRKNLWRLDTTLDKYYSVTNELVRQSMQDIDLMVYFPPYWLPKYDGVRSPVVGYQKDIDLNIQEGIEEFYYNSYLVMKHESVENRVDKIVKAFNDLQK